MNRPAPSCPRRWTLSATTSTGTFVFRPDQALGRKEGLDYQVQLFHRGFLFKSSVDLFLVKGGVAEPVPFSKDLFDYGANAFGEPLPDDLGFAGFRVHYPLNRPEYLDELFVFLGASYFRSLGRGQLYGLSSRGLAIDTATPKGEEFPIFRSFWIEQPVKGAKQIVVHALLDTPSATGAYRFEVKPGATVVMDVTATVFPRTDIEKIGFAPLTSMYLHGENDRVHMDDFRPEVHDSDGLLLWLGTGERLWRPLSNPSKLRVASFQVQALRGFGLLQRDRAFTSYEDLEARYERRPSAWVEPLEGFGPGTVTLVEIPTQEEIHDNITAFYTPQAAVTAGAELKLRYRLHWGGDIPAPTPVAQTVATRISAGSRPGPEASCWISPPRHPFRSLLPGRTRESVAPASPSRPWSRFRPASWDLPWCSQTP